MVDELLDGQAVSGLVLSADGRALAGMNLAYPTADGVTGSLTLTEVRLDRP